MRLVGIAGGSGAGKSTLARALHKALPNSEVVRFDDYVKQYELCHEPDSTNWEQPSAYEFGKLYSDLSALLKGDSVPVLDWNEDKNPNFQLELRSMRTIHPKDIVILEGFLILNDKRIRGLLDYSVFLDLPLEKRLNRRKRKPSEQYLQEVFIPMQHAYIEPAKQYADYVLDVSNLTPEETQTEVLRKLKKVKIL